MKTRFPLLILALFATAAYGIGSAMFSQLAYDMAATIGLSSDEVVQVKTGFMIAQIWGFMFAPLLVRKYGAYPSLFTSLLVGLITNMLLYWQLPSPYLFTITWLCSGFFMSMLLIVVNLYLLDGCESRWLPAIIATTLVFTTLLPMGAYPWLVARLLEVFDWSLFCVVSAWLYFSALVVASLFRPALFNCVAKPKSGYLVYAVLAVTFGLVVYLLMRGNYYNWLDSPWFSQLTAAAAALVLFALYLWVKTAKRNTASMQLHGKLQTNVFMYNAFLAGFAVMASTALFGNFLEMALHYNHLNAGGAQLPSFFAMLAGMLVSVLVYCCRRPLTDVVVPFGVLMILLSVYAMSQLPNQTGPESLVLPMLLRGFGVGLLNVSVTITVLMYYQVDERIEGMANFYLFRTMGSLIAGAYFARVMQSHSAQASGEIGRTLNRASHNFSVYEHALGEAILTHGRLPSPSLGISQIGSVVKQQVMTLALSNSLIVFICSVFVLAPILVIRKKLAVKQPG